VRFSLAWIKDYVEIEEESGALARLLTMAGLPVDRVERPSVIPDTVVVGKVLEVRRHPNADRLSLCRVDAGGGETVEVVCGAPNVRAGMHSPLARVGSVLPNGMTLRRSKIRGEISNGMLCSEIELGLGEDAAGIMDIAPAEPGTPFSEVLGPRDAVLDIDVPSNRGDCLCHLGIAREIAALTGKPLTLPPTQAQRSGSPVTEEFRVAVEDPEDCPRFTAHLIRGVTVGPSPDWLRHRLEAAGQRSINNVVDVTNFVMLEMGQPLHSFDLQRLGTGRILVRRARPGERLTTLDDQDRALDPQVLLVTDGKRPIAAGGVMGGANTEVTDATRDILLEAAWFRPERVLRGSRFLRLDTEAAIRFRRGVDPASVDAAARRAAQLLAETAGGKVAPGMAEALDPALLDPRRVTLRPAVVGRTLGDPVGDDEVATRLEAFGFSVERAADAPWTVTVPAWRRDVFEECDLVEEVGRHRGYDAIGERQYNASAVGAPIQPEEKRRHRVGEVLRGFGFNEIVTRCLVREDAAARVGIAPGPSSAAFLPLMDPPSREEQGLRVTLLPSLLDAVSHNLRHGRPEARLYEIGTTFDRRREGPLPEETTWVGLAAAGGGFTPSLERSQRSLNFLEFKGFVEGLLAAFQIDAPKWRPYNGLDLFPPGSIELMDGDRSAGFAWEAGPEAASAWDLARPVYLAQIRLDALPLDTGAPRLYREPSRFPAVRRDLALIVPGGFTQDEVRGWIRAEAGEHLQGIELFDHYRGKHIPPGHVGLGFSVIFRAPDRTLEEKEVDAAVDRVVAGLRRKGIVRREA
jgi:phenylalanyl-tRNA synthetase beta chain